MRLIIDQDQVICKWCERVLEWYNEDNGTSFTTEDIKSWDVTSDMPPDAKYFIRACMRYPEFYRDLEPVDGAIVGMKKLIDAGHDVIIATAVPKSAGVSYAGKLEWLRRDMPFFDLSNFVAISRKYLLDGDILLDDGVHNLEPWIASGRTGVVFDQPWNREFTNADKRVTHWNEFVDYIDELQLERK